MYCEDIDDILYFNKLEEYEKSIPYKQFLSIREFLHDTDIVIKKRIKMTFQFMRLVETKQSVII